MRANWHCPDSYPPAEPGRELPIHPDLTDDFPECPAASLRTAHEVELVSIRLGRPAYSAHLVDGMDHPYEDVSAYMVEIENGARMAESLSPRVLELVHLGFREKEKKRQYEAKERREARE